MTSCQNLNELPLSIGLWCQLLSPIQFVSCCESDKYLWLRWEFPKIMFVNCSQWAGFTSNSPIDSSKHWKPFSVFQLQEPERSSEFCFVAHANEGKLNPRFSWGAQRYYGNELKRLCFPRNPILAELASLQKCFLLVFLPKFNKYPAYFSCHPV